MDIRSGAILHEKLIPEELILPTLETLRSFGLHRAYHTYERVYVDKNTPRANKWYRPPVPPTIEVEDVANLYPQRCIKVAGIGDAETLRDKRRELERIFAGKLYVTQSSFDLIEFLHPEVSKGNALKAIAADLRIPPQEIVAIGDNHNDIGMIRFAGLGVAMGNAHDEVKTQADYVTLSNAEDGVARVIEELILPKLE
jgi:Cof subfamily protein (haloacid dehalogenase superfamily)